MYTSTVRRLAAATAAALLLTACPGAETPGGERLRGPGVPGGDEDPMVNPGRDELEEPDAGDPSGE